MQHRRQIFLIDKDTQGRITRRLLTMWIVGGMLILAVPVVVNILFGIFLSSVPPAELAQNIFRSIWFPIFTALLVIPIGLRHSVKFSNRIAGPVYRVKKEMANLLEGKPVRPIKLRKGDFFADLTDQFNQLAESFQQSQESHQSPDTSKSNGDNWQTTTDEGDETHRLKVMSTSVGQD